MNAKHKWEAECHLPNGSADGYWQVIDSTSDNGDVMAIIDPDDVLRELDVDTAQMADLIAAAPELLEALRAMLDRFQVNTPDGYHDPGGVIRLARAAIAKAEGSADV